MKRLILILTVVTSCFVCTDAHGSSLFGKVIDVNSGDVITIFNLNRPVRVKLLGVDAPEMDQAFGEVAKKHLADLVYDKSVIVEYSGIAADGSLTGRVLLDKADINAQMIRDGAAWFDPNNVTRLSATDRDVYQHSEQAARNERRGLWEMENPTAPWEFVKAQTAKKNPVVTQSLNVNASSRRAKPANSELTNLTLMKMPATKGTTQSMSTDEIRAKWRMLNSSEKQWNVMRPAGQDFSALMPDGGQQLTHPLPFGGEMVDFTIHNSQEGGNLYSVFWFEAQSYGEADKAAIDAMVLETIKTTHERYQQADRGHFSCPQKREKEVSMNGYFGTEFDMSTCSLPTRARAFTKVVDNQRYMYVAIVFYADDNENVTRFIKSFIAGPRKSTSKGK